MAQAITTSQNQNVQLTKTFIVAFGAVLLALPIVTIITASIVQAQFGSLVHAQPAQTNSIGGMVTCELPADEKQAVHEAAAAAKSNPVVKYLGWLPGVSQSNHYSRSTSTTTNTDNSKVIIKDNGNTDNRWSGNTLVNDSFNKKTIIKDNGNTLNLLNNVGNTTNTDNSKVIVKDNGNTNNHIHDNGNTTNTVNDNDNTNVNSGNTVNNDNDGVGIL